jgi:hypothetical protein
MLVNVMKKSGLIAIRIRNMVSKCDTQFFLSSRLFTTFVLDWADFNSVDLIMRYFDGSARSQID